MKGETLHLRAAYKKEAVNGARFLTRAELSYSLFQDFCWKKRSISLQALSLELILP